MSRDHVIDVHTHTFHSDGSLSPMELVRRAVVNGYSAIGITDHVGLGGVADLLALLHRERDIIERYWPIQVFVGVELTHVPAEAIADAATFARNSGAELVVVHGETPVEPVPPGTNHASIVCGFVDVLAHPGLLTLEDARLAAEGDVFLEITARKGHSLTNGHVLRVAQASGARLIVNSDSHDPGDLLTPAFQERVARGAGMTDAEIHAALETNPVQLIRRLIERRNAGTRR